MKISFKVLGLTCLFILLFSVNAFASTDPHGNYTADTASCAQCHKTHTASSPDLIAFTLNGSENYIYRTCIFCHDGTGSDYDEVDGQYIDSSGNKWPTAGGGFVNMATIGGPSGVAATAPVTSIHQVDKPENTKVNIPGGSNSANGKIELTCVSCHDPHGTSNSDLLLNSITVYNDTTSTFQTINTTGVTITTTSTPNGTVTYNSAISNFCGACHTDYLQTTTGPTGTYDTNLYRHPVAQNGYDYDVRTASGFNIAKFALPTTGTTGGTVTYNMTCMTCHYAHGTTATVSTSTYDPAALNPPLPVSPATLLRMDERGVCQNCHNKTPDQTQPTVLNDQSYVTTDGVNTYAILTFSTYMSSASAAQTGNYTVSNGVTVSSAALEPNGILGKQVLLKLSGSIPQGTVITVNGVSDLNGNTISSSGNTFTVK